MQVDPVTTMMGRCQAAFVAAYPNERSHQIALLCIHVDVWEAIVGPWTLVHDRIATRHRGVGPDPQTALERLLLDILGVVSAS